MPFKYFAVIAIVFSLFASTFRAGSSPGKAVAASWPEIALLPIVKGLEAPVHITHAGDGSGRVFIVEQAGRIRILSNGGLSGTFLDITDRVRSPFNGGGNEEGLLSLAFPPSNSLPSDHFYVYYTQKDGNNRLSRFYLSQDADEADPNSEEIILTFDHPNYQNHNGGQLAFGPQDRALYIGTGDGGGGGDPDGNAQDPSSLLGKLLRIDVETGGVPYTIPEDNPFIGVPGYRPEIWALGLRNPWRFSFDRLTGDLYLGDVGQSSWEEIDYQPADSPGGQNYGWNILEGFECYQAPNCDETGMTSPVHVYPTHVEGSCSVTGGYVYRGPLSPGMTGIYFFADYCNGKIWGLREESGVWVSQELLDTTTRPTSFGEGEAGFIYLADAQSGTLYQIVENIHTNPIYLPVIVK